jgi:hypothetical protein
MASVRRAILANNLKPTIRHLINLDVVVSVVHDVAGRTVAYFQVNGQQRPLPDGSVASRKFMITPMPYLLLSYYRFRMGA